MLERKAAEEQSRKAEPAPESAAEVATGAETPAPTDAVPGEDVSQVREELAARQVECDQLKDQLLRARAEFDNYRKRMLRETDQTRQAATSNLIRVLLPVLDNLERALAHASEEDGLTVGVRMVHKQLVEALAAEGLEPIPATGTVFDPAVHDALVMTPSATVAQGLILEEFERGYKLREQVLRPAKVIVSSGPEMNEAAASGPDKVSPEEETPSSGE